MLPAPPRGAWHRKPSRTRPARRTRPRCQRDTLTARADHRRLSVMGILGRWRRQEHRRRDPRHGRSGAPCPAEGAARVHDAGSPGRCSRQRLQGEPRTNLTASRSSIQRRISGTQPRSCPDRPRDGTQPPPPTAGHPNCHKPMAPRETKVPVAGSAVGRVDG